MAPYAFNKYALFFMNITSLKYNPRIMSEKNLYISSLFGGAAAGLSVDMILFPLDTIKTRLQSAQGFRNSGGFSGIYKGIGPQAIGSAPQAALFFCTYESCKYFMTPLVPQQALPIVYMAGASLAEVVACLVRVPMEVVKQRRQTCPKNSTSMAIALDAWRSEGLLKGLYRGFGSTIIREVPFSFVQFPILEFLKRTYRIKFKNNEMLSSFEVASCGAIAGGVSAAITTPLDVVKTRIMLADKSLTVNNMFKLVYKEKGVAGLFAGFVPRVLWITLGGYIFFGTYDFARNFCSNHVLQEPLDLDNI
ncbi:S-adenosylmethionine mitochondrial carrier protein homolog [Onthophagus taurus]|uniref:S-adenosylmethionine mitochondrial carrier protein homolog n=1 Tax=Onthophagus taurus TaxID=166361 RepID=UPI0039BDE494